MSEFNYAQAFALLGDDAVVSVSEVHGLVSGFVCAGTLIDGKSWLEPILMYMDEGQFRRESHKTLLLEMYKATSVSLQNLDFGFELLLPDDECPLQERAKALSMWCQGFTIALDRVGFNIDNPSLGSTKETLENITAIANMDYEAIEVSESDEVAYNDVMEYVRMATILIYSEINELGSGQQNLTGSHKLH